MSGLEFFAASTLFLALAGALPVIGVPPVRVAGSGPAVSGSAPGAIDPDSAAVAALEHRVEAAAARRDAAFLDRVLAPTFQFKHAGTTGRRESRSERMAALRRPAPPGLALSRVVDSLEVERHGDVALTSGRIHVKVTGSGARDSEYTVRYVRVYRRTPRGWQLLTHHSTAQTQGPPPPLAGPAGSAR